MEHFLATRLDKGNLFLFARALDQIKVDKALIGDSRAVRLPLEVIDSVRVDIDGYRTPQLFDIGIRLGVNFRDKFDEWL